MSYTRKYPLVITPDGDDIEAATNKINNELDSIISVLNSTGALQLFGTKRQSVLYASTDASGIPNYLTSSGLNVSIDGSVKPVILTFANGFLATQGTVDIIDKIDSIVSGAWTLPANQTCYLYVDKDINTGLLSYNYSLLSCPRQRVAPSSPALDQHYFNSVEMKMYRYNGTSWEQKQRIFIAIATTTATTATIKIINSMDEAFFSGMITLFSGAITSIPNGWALCDGTNGTPDLRNRMIVGAGSTYAVGATGGEATHILTTAEMPSHTHTAWTDSQGAHTHTYVHSSGSNSAPGGYTDGWSSYVDNTGVSGAHGHNVGIGANGSGAAHNNMPPYYALAYIMKL